jgi:hypothetical protein
MSLLWSHTVALAIRKHPGSFVIEGVWLAPVPVEP